MPRGWACRLELLLALASAVVLGSESRRTHDHILLSQTRDSPSLEGQVHYRVQKSRSLKLLMNVCVHRKICLQRLLDQSKWKPVFIGRYLLSVEYTE
jgi:hypothetical protein